MSVKKCWIKNFLKKKLNEIQNELWSEKIVNQDYQVKLKVCSERITDVETKISETNDKLKILSEQLKTRDFKNQSEDILNNWFNYYSKELDNYQNIKNKYITELQEVIDSAVKKSDISDWFSDFIEKYRRRRFLNNLSLDQIVALFNIICDIMVLMALTSISILLIGDYLIKNFNLESKYPRLYKYIKFRENLNKYYLKFYIILLYVIII